MEYDSLDDFDFELGDELALSAGATETDEERQLRIMEGYTSALPFACESAGEMYKELNRIVSKILIAAEGCHWDHLITWTKALNSWLSLKYPFPREIRASLAKLFWELVFIPWLEFRYVNFFASTLIRLIRNRLGSRRKLELKELTLPWARLWKLVELEISPSHRVVMTNSSRNLCHVLLELAEACCDYFAASEIPNMLDTFLPLVTQDTASTMFSVMAAFLPASHAALYLPFMFKSWEAFHSYTIEDSMLSQFASLSVAHVAGTASEYGPEGSFAWRDVGIYSDAEWSMIMRACLSSMSIPVGCSEGGVATSIHEHQSDLSCSCMNDQRYACLAQIIVYSMSVDGPTRLSNGEAAKSDVSAEKTFLAGSKALDSLDRLITSVETFFHPSNSGAWTLKLLTFVQSIAAEFSTRWNDEQLPSCKTPVAQRLTLEIKRSFVQVFRTPVLLSMFSKDPVATSYAQVALKYLSTLEPDLIMPQLLERAVSGLEAINETHRTTAAIGALAAVPSALTVRSVWLKGQKHLVPLLEMCLPGIDINDYVKTIVTTHFITNTLQFIKIGDLNVEGGVPLVHDAPDEKVALKPEGSDTPFMKPLSGKELSEEEIEEDGLVKQSTAGFTDWVVSFFRRVFALYENLPEEGGKSRKTGGKIEDVVLTSLNAALDVVCANLSDSLFTLILDLVFKYCTTNAKTNSVRSIGDLVSLMARTRPKETISKFLPFTIRQIEMELGAGASSVRTTSNTAATLPSDTTFHWNLALIKAALTHSGADLVEFKEDLLSLMSTLRKARNERGYSGFGLMVNGILATLTGTYPLEQRIVNPGQWNDACFERSHHYSWGIQFSNPKDVEVQWHVPSAKELEFAINILQTVISPMVDQLEELIQAPHTNRDGIWINDFCRTMYLVQSAWSGTSSLLMETAKSGGDMGVDESDVAGLSPSFTRPRAAFALSDPADPRYQVVQALRERFGKLLHQSFLALTHEVEMKSEAADAVNAVIQLVRALNVYLLHYGSSRNTISTLKQQLTTAQDNVKTHPRQCGFPRLVWIKRAALYGYSRMFQHTCYRDRSALDDQLLLDLVELALSPYRRVRQYSQSTLSAALAHYQRAWRLVIPRIFEELNRESLKGKDADSDRQKGALHTLSDETVLSVSYNLWPSEYLSCILACQSQEKPSIQKLVARIVSDVLSCLTEESLATTVFLVPLPELAEACAAGHRVNKTSTLEQLNREESLSKTTFQAELRRRRHEKLTSELLAITRSSLTARRYKEYAIRFISSLLCRDHPPSPNVAALLSENATSDEPDTRAYSQRGLTRLLLHVKMRSFSQNPLQLWTGQWINPLRQDVSITDPSKFIQDLETPFTEGSSNVLFVDKEKPGFLTWPKVAKAYRPPPSTGLVLVWDSESQPGLNAIRSSINEIWIQNYTTLISQEESEDLQPDNVMFLKSLFKTFEAEILEPFLKQADALVFSYDRFQQRAGFEILAGALRGSKNWAFDAQSKLWEWFTTRLSRLFNHIKPEVAAMWDEFLTIVLEDRDPRRMQPLVDFVVVQNIELNTDSAFVVTKRLSMIAILVDALGSRIESRVPSMVDLYFDNVQAPYAEVRARIAENLEALTRIQWHPRYLTAADLVTACAENNDALRIRKAEHLPRIESFIQKFDQWRLERLPPPRVSQSTYDRAGVTLLQWIWHTAHSIRASSVFPYVMPLLPEIFKMAKLNDSSELQLRSSAVLIALSAISPPRQSVGTLIDNLTETVKSSPSWRIRLSVMPFLQVFYFRNLLNLPDDSVQRVMDVLLECLQDENVEVRENAAKTLSGVIRCSQRQSIPLLKERFTRLARKTKLPQRSEKDRFATAIRTLHSAVLGLCALLDTYPYSVEPWAPQIIEILALYSADPIPISSTIRNCVQRFKQTHQDTWAIDQLAFNEEQIQALSTIVSGTSYFA